MKKNELKLLFCSSLQLFTFISVIKAHTCCTKPHGHYQMFIKASKVQKLKRRETMIISGVNRSGFVVHSLCCLVVRSTSVSRAENVSSQSSDHERLRERKYNNINTFAFCLLSYNERDVVDFLPRQLLF